MLVRTRTNKDFAISVKAVRGGGKWGVGGHDYSKETNLIFVLLHYKNFDDVRTRPESYVVPAEIIERCKRKWFKQFGVYYSHHKLKADLEAYREAWHLIS